MKDYSNYHGTSADEKINHDGLLLLEKSLNGFEGHDVLINSTVNSKVLIYQKWDADSETKKVIGRIEDIDRGNVFGIGELDWLVTTIPEDNKIYRKAEMRLCNSTFPIQSDKTRVLIGTDSDGRPVYDYTSTSVSVPCIVENNINSDLDNSTLPLPDGRINITMKYQTAENLTVNSEFGMYGNSYKILDFDYTKVIGDKGIMIIHAERSVK